MAGGGGMALLMFIPSCLAMIGLLAHKAWKQPIPKWLIALALFLTWAWIAQFWSPYAKTAGFSNAEKLWVMGLIFPSVIWLWAQMCDHILGKPLRMAIIAALSISILALVIDSFSGFKISYIFSPPQEGPEKDWRPVYTARNLVRGIIFCVAMILPLMALLSKSRWGVAFSIFLLLLVTGAAWKMDVDIALIVSWAGILMGFFALKFPVQAVRFVFFLAISAIVLAPLMAGLISVLEASIIESLPGSWEHRLYMWRFVYEQILNHPYIGHGFDSSRTFAETVTLNNGKTVSVISLHPHNAGLQIWLETGVIGVLLACATICALFRPAIAFVKSGKAQAFGLCGFLTVMILISSTSFGVWQFWWWGTLSFGFACLRLVPIATKSDLD